jgi:carbamoyltransferase
MVTVLGIFYPYPALAGHEGNVTLVKDGKILAAVEEDKIVRVKHYGFIPPYNAIKEVFRITKIDPKDVDAIAVPAMEPTKAYFRFLKHFLTFSKYKSAYKYLLSFPNAYKRVMDAKKLVSELGMNCPVIWTEHHLAHAAASFLISGFKSATTVTVDGGGDLKGSSVYLSENGNMKEVGYSLEGTLGNFYSAVTSAIGFKGNEEGKTMGLACYGSPNVLAEEFDKFIEIKDIKIVKKKEFGEIATRVRISDERLFSPYRHQTYLNNPFTNYLRKYKKEDIAAAAQYILEKKVSELVKNAINKTGVGNICLGGGVALNMKMNMKIREMEEVEDIFICPSPGDSGISMGAALLVCKKLMEKEGKTFKNERLEHMYFGPEYSNEEIEKTLENYRVLKYEKLRNPSKTAAELIAEGKVIGWFQGRLEFGPRALGNRSVLADPRDIKMKDRINHKLKHRDWFMPFAPSILNDYKEEYLENACEAPFMIMGFNVKKDKIKEIPAVVHVDGTARPQTVKKDVNERYYKLIDNFRKITGIPLVLNTSFNKHGLPIVRSPEDAILHVIWKCVDCLIIGDYFVYL